MSLADILAAMERTAADEEASILLAARQRADELLRDARAQAQAVRDRYELDARRSAATEGARIQGEGALRVVAIRAATRDRLVEQVFEEVVRVLASARLRPDYPRLLEALLREALDELEPGVPAVVECDPRDLPLLEPLGARTGFTLAPCLTTAGGCVATSSEGAVRADNTLERRAEQARVALWQDVARLLSAPEPGGAPPPPKYRPRHERRVPVAVR